MDRHRTETETAFRLARRTGQLKPSAIRAMLKATESPEVISFAGGLPAPELFPVEEFAHACQEVLTEDRGAALQYSTTEGYPPLRQWVCDHLWQAIKLRCTPEQLLITTGSQQALDLIAKVLIDPGDTVLVENPAYLGALQAFDAYEAKLVGVACDENGIIPVELRATLAKLSTPPKFLYAIPNFQNPTGVSLSVERRAQVAQIAAEFGVPIFEDDPYGRLRYAGEEPPPISALDAAQNSIYTGTTSKIIAPGMRVAWLVVRDHELYEKLIPAKQSADLHTATFTQRVVWRYARQADVLKQHMQRLLDTYRRRRDTMLEALQQHMPNGCSWTKPDGGLFLWCSVPPQIDTVELLRQSTAQKVAFVPGAPFWVGKDIRNTLRLNFSNASEDRIRDGIARLGVTLKTMLQKR